MKVRPGSKITERWGFTKSKFSSCSLLDIYVGDDWRYVDVLFIQSKQRGKGDFRKLVENILSENLGIFITIPIGRMEKIVKSWRFTRHDDNTWYLKPGSKLPRRKMKWKK